MNTTANLFEDKRPTTIEATGAELLRVCADARAGLVTIMALSVAGNGRYVVRVVNTAKQPITSEAIP